MWEGIVMAGSAAKKAGINIGPKLRTRRKELNLTLDELASQCGVTKGFLSDVERDKASPSVATLIQVCSVLSLPVGDLFTPSESAIIRKADRAPIKYGGHDIQDYMINPYRQSRMQAIISVMEPGGGGGKQLYSVDSDEEFVFVIQGRVRIILETEEVVLEEGDTMTFNPRLMHSFMNDSETEPANALFIVTPVPRESRAAT